MFFPKSLTHWARDSQPPATDTAAVLRDILSQHTLPEAEDGDALVLEAARSNVRCVRHGDPGFLRDQDPVQVAELVALVKRQGGHLLAPTAWAYLCEGYRNTDGEFMEPADVNLRWWNSLSAAKKDAERQRLGEKGR